MFISIAILVSFFIGAFSVHAYWAKWRKIRRFYKANEVHNMLLKNPWYASKFPRDKKK